MDSGSLVVEIEKKNYFALDLGFSGGYITMRACFENFGYLWPALGSNSLTHYFDLSFVENYVKIRVYSALD